MVYFRFLLIWGIISTHILIAVPEEPFREFSNTAGQTIKARPISVFGETVRIAFEDGRELNVTLDAFTASDQAYLLDWVIKHLATNDHLISVDVSRKEDKVKDYKKDVGLTNGKTIKGALRVKEYAGYYEITLENRSKFELKKLRVEYRIFSQQELQAKKDSGDVRYERAAGQLSFTLKPSESSTRKTSVINMVETTLGKGIQWSGGGDLKAKAKMVGVWLRVYNGSDQIDEFSVPSTLPSRERW